MICRSVVNEWEVCVRSPLAFSLTIESALTLQNRCDEQVHGCAHQVVDRSDQWPRRYGRVLLQFIQHERFNRADGGRGSERRNHANKDRERELCNLGVLHVNEKPDNAGNRPADEAEGKTRASFRKDDACRPR